MKVSCLLLAGQKTTPHVLHTHFKLYCYLFGLTQRSPIKTQQFDMILHPPSQKDNNHHIVLNMILALLFQLFDYRCEMPATNSN